MPFFWTKNIVVFGVEVVIMVKTMVFVAKIKNDFKRTRLIDKFLLN